MKKNAIATYLRESFEELHRVTWPTRNQAIRMAGIVLGFTIVFSFIIAGVDFLLNEGFKQLINYFK